VLGVFGGIKEKGDIHEDTCIETEAKSEKDRDRE